MSILTERVARAMLKSLIDDQGYDGPYVSEHEGCSVGRLEDLVIDGNVDLLKVAKAAIDGVVEHLKLEG